MALDDDHDFSGGDSVGGGTDRALNDIGLSIGFAMMVLLFVVLSSVTALQNVAVNLPQIDSDAAGSDAPPVPVVAIDLEAGADGALEAVRADGEPLDMNAPLEAPLTALYGAVLADGTTVELHILADGGLSHASVSEAVFRLHAAFGSLGGETRKVVVRYVARAAD